MLDTFEFLDGNIRRERVMRNRLDPFTFYDELEFKQRYRSTKTSVLELTHLIEHKLERKHKTWFHVPPVIQTLIALRFYGSGSFLKVIGDMFGVHECTASVIIKDVSEAIASLRQTFIKFPSGQRAHRIQHSFMQLSGIPGIIGAIDCTHVPILSPGGHQAELFRNRKGYFSVNVQAICDDDLKFSNIVARWPGSTHDSRIFENSHIAAKLESREITGTLLGDNGYPLRAYLLTPLLKPITRAEIRFNQHVSRARVKVENLFGVWKRRFPCLRHVLRLKLNTALVVIVATAVVHNYAREKNDPLPDDDDELPPAESVPVQPVRKNEGGQALRNLMIRLFQ